MEGPSPVIHNLLFEDRATGQPARITFTYYDGNTPHEVVLTEDQVRKNRVCMQPLDDDVETYFVTCETTTLFLGVDNQSLFRQWAHRQGIHLGSQLMGK